jgi:hypothetical protein
MSEFRFHLTLIGPITNPDLAAHIKKALDGLLTEKEAEFSQSGIPLYFHSGKSRQAVFIAQQISPGNRSSSKC